MLGKTVRTWAPFVYIERMLKNLVTSLRAITELQNPAIRDRHWLELMKVTGVSTQIAYVAVIFYLIHFLFSILKYTAVVCKVWNVVFGKLIDGHGSS